MNRVINHSSVSKTVWVSNSGEAVVQVTEGYYHVNGNYVHLTYQETRLLDMIISGDGNVLTKLMMLKALYTDKLQADQKIIDVLICKIRNKLKEKHSDAVDIIATVWGRGYALSVSSGEEGLKRWVPSVKAKIINSITDGKRPIDAVLQEYPRLSNNELLEWLSLWSKAKQPGLRVTHAQSYAKA